MVRGAISAACYRISAANNGFSPTFPWKRVGYFVIFKVYPMWVAQEV
jgi:hypothetical protein